MTTEELQSRINDLPLKDVNIVVGFLGDYYAEEIQDVEYSDEVLNILIKPPQRVHSWLCTFGIHDFVQDSVHTKICQRCHLIKKLK